MKTITIVRDVMEKNANQAAKNRELFKKHNVFCVNIMGSPGAGKTSLIESILDLSTSTAKTGIIEGDFEGTTDTERLSRYAIPVIQINSRSCHLNADFVAEAIKRLPLDELDLVLIENVGNLICPATHDLGEDMKLVLLSVPEGSDKLEKYPKLFSIADALVITKVDLLPHCDFSIQKAVRDFASLNPTGRVFQGKHHQNDTFQDLYQFILDRHAAR